MPTVVATRDQLLDRIARGGMGEVWSGRDEILGRRVAVKVLRAELAGDPTFRERFRAEARAAASLNHPGIAAVFDYGETPGPGGDPTPYLVMELVDGRPLSEVLRRDGALEVTRALDLVAQVADALQRAHERSIVHRDVKPANLLVTDTGTVKVTDFGIAWAMHAAPLTVTGPLLGTVHYMAPEQLMGRRATPASDVYALGVVIFEVLAGTVPFPGRDPMAVARAHVRDPVPEVGADLPAEVRALVTGLLAKDPDRRPRSAGEVAEQARGIRGRLLGPGPRAASPVDVRATAAGVPPTPEATLTSVPSTRLDPPAPTLVPEHTIRPRRAATVRTRRGLAARRRPGRWLVLVLVLMALGGLAAGLAAAGGSPRAVRVPRLEGLGGVVARHRLDHLGLRAAVTHVDAPEPAGSVVAQHPRPGRRLSPGQVVTLTEASGYVRVDPAHYVGAPSAIASQRLGALGLRSLQHSVETSASTAGTVTAVSPTGRLREGTLVSMTVATAPPPPAPAPTAPTPRPEPHVGDGPPGPPGPHHHGSK